MLSTRLLAVLAALCCATLTPVQAQSSSVEDTIVQAREALRVNNKAQLAAAVRTVNSAGHPLAQWVEYWELSNRLAQAQQDELESFYARWPGTYVEDRLRNDWMLELGKRRDWPHLRTELPRFRMNDDREVACYALLLQHLDGQNVTNAAAAAWHAQRDADNGCELLAQTLVEARVMPASDVWQEIRLSVEANRLRAARAASAFISPAVEKATADLLDNPVRYLSNKRAAVDASTAHELDLLALMRAAANDPEATAQLIDTGSRTRLPIRHAATAWAHVARHAAMKQAAPPNAAAEYARRAWILWDKATKPGIQPPWSDDLMAWHVRAALREGGNAAPRWQLVQRAIEGMTATEQRDSAWVYWKARATQALAKAGAEGDAQRNASKQALAELATQVNFYGRLAAADLGQAPAQPAPPLALSPEERATPKRDPGFLRALLMIQLGLRNEGVREWNFGLRGLSDRELLAAAQLACEREVWDRCINTSERSKADIDMAQRFPTPHREAIVKEARAAGLDPALVFGLIRQESRFITDNRSHVGASGLMQLMPATARWMAKKLGVPYKPEQINDRDLNLQLGANYLKRLVDDFEGSLPMATAAYNAGPNRPRRWRDGAVLEPAAWAETIPFHETRDYVKKVLNNAVDYAAVLGQPPTSIKARLGPAVGPRSSTAAPERDLP